jgi:uncharacterized membrane protein YecN with MAPEG domain
LTIGSYRWGRILSGRATFDDYGEYTLEKGEAWYRRAMRAHANCVENLPIFGAIVVTIAAAGLQSWWLSLLSIVVIGARIPHTIVHVFFEQTNTVVGFRSAFYNIQFFAMQAMVVVVVVLAVG